MSMSVRKLVVLAESGQQYVFFCERPRAKVIPTRLQRNGSPV